MSLKTDKNNENNLDIETVASFGDEWTRLDQTGLTEDEAAKAFHEYFSVFPWNDLPANAEGFDMGCGSGRWARFVAPRVSHLNCIDPSKAIEIARKNLTDFTHIEYYQASVDSSGLPPESQDFGYSLGVLHHVPDTAAAVRSCAVLLKPGAPLLLYLYYAFDNRSFWYRSIWKISDWARKLIMLFSPNIKQAVTDVIAILVYWPLARLSGVLERKGVSIHSIPLSYYRNHSFYAMRTDARDRFGTPMEQRFTKQEIVKMMDDAGLENIRFSDQAPFWCVSGTKRK